MNSQDLTEKVSQYFPSEIFSGVDFKIVGCMLLSGFVGAASCMAVQTLVSLDEVELKEKKEREAQEEVIKLKLVPDWRYETVDLQKYECISKLPLISINPKKITIKYHGQIIASSCKVLCFMQDRYWPRYFFPPQDVNKHLLKETTSKGFNSQAGVTLWCDIVIPNIKNNENFDNNNNNNNGENLVCASAAQKLIEIPTEAFSILKDYYYFVPAAVQTFEEEEEVFGRPHHPWIHIDCVNSSRHVVVQINGMTIADSMNPILVFETGSPTRYFIRKEDIKMELLEESPTNIHCSYKGKQTHWTLQNLKSSKAAKMMLDADHSGAVISFEEPTQAFQKIKGYICFLQEYGNLIITVDDAKLDTIEFNL